MSEREEQIREIQEWGFSRKQAEERYDEITTGWQRTQEERDEKMIAELVQAGVDFSKAIRATGASEVSQKTYFGKWSYLIRIASLAGDRPLVDYANVADLNSVYAGRTDQAAWGTARWEKEIRARFEISYKLRAS